MLAEMAAEDRFQVEGATVVDTLKGLLAPFSSPATAMRIAQQCNKDSYVAEDYGWVTLDAVKAAVKSRG